MTAHLRISPARVSGERSSEHSRGLARPAPVLRLGVTPGAVVLQHLRPGNADAPDGDRRLVFPGVHRRVLGVAPDPGRVVSREEEFMKKAIPALLCAGAL